MQNTLLKPSQPGPTSYTLCWMWTQLIRRGWWVEVCPRFRIVMQERSKPWLFLQQMARILLRFTVWPPLYNWSRVYHLDLHVLLTILLIACILSVKQTSECKKHKKKVHQYPGNYKTSIAYNWGKEAQWCPTAEPPFRNFKSLYKNLQTCTL
jgi:hypothetical protein